MQRRKLRAVAIGLIIATGGVGAWSGLAAVNAADLDPAQLPPISVMTEVKEANVEERIRINEKGPSEVSVSHLTVPPGANSPWHYHPGPHIVLVKTGTVEIYETDCGEPGVYEAGEGFFDPGPTNQPHVHMLRNPGEVAAELVLTDIRQPGLPLTVVPEDQPPTCF